jgi:predicted nuclease of predicted toxin-antitoxin system
MKILLDECLPKKLKGLLVDFEVKTVREMEWSGILNGELIKSAIDNGFDVFIKADKNLRYQQNIANHNISIILLSVVINTLEKIKPLVPELLELLPKSERRMFYIIGE